MSSGKRWTDEFQEPQPVTRSVLFEDRCGEMTVCIVNRDGTRQVGYKLRLDEAIATVLLVMGDGKVPAYLKAPSLMRNLEAHYAGRGDAERHDSGNAASGPGQARVGLTPLDTQERINRGEEPRR